jgi:hypothetical protein
MSAQPERLSYRWLTVAVAVALGVYAWYGSTQYDRLNELNHRQLSNAGAELKTAIDNAVATVEEFNRRWAKFPSSKKPPVCSFVRGQPYLELDGCESNNSPEDVTWGRFTTAHAVADSALAIKVEGGTGPSRRFRYRTDKLLQELAFSDAFALVFVTTDEGVVLFEDAPARRQWLRQLRWGEQTFRDAHVDRPPTLQIHNLQQLVGGADAWKRLQSVSSRTTVSLAGVAYQLYLQPLALEGEHSMRLVVGAAVPRATVLQDALALGAPMVGVMAFLVLLALLGFPFVKLAVLDRHERFSRRDVILLYASSGALLVLFTCASLALDGYVRWNTEADRGLAPFASHLEERFREEVTAIRNQAAVYDALVSGWEPKNCQRWTVDTEWFARQPGGGEHLPWPPTSHLKTVAWIDPAGWQVWKSTADAIPGKTFVGHRAYFRAVRDDNLFRIDGKGPAIFLGPDRSIVDGKFYTFVSMPSQTTVGELCSNRAGESGRLVVSVTAQLLSLDRQPLPAGYGFALINREGRVLYHSDGRLSLRENLFEELAEGGRARAMIYAGAGGGFDTRYRERPHRFHFQPIGLVRHGSPPGFYLAVFRDTSVGQALASHVFVVGLVAPMVLLVGLGTVLLMLLWHAARHQRHSWLGWLWPHRGLDRMYKSQGAAFLALLVVATGLYLSIESITLFLITPLLAFGLGGAIYAALGFRQVERLSLCTPIWQRSSVFLGLVCMVVVPTAALFRVALGHEFAKLIVTEQQWIAAQREDLPRAALFEVRDERYAEARARALLKTRALYAGCVPAPFDASGSPRHVDDTPLHVPDVLRAAYVAPVAEAEAAPLPLEGCVNETPAGGGAAAPVLTPAMTGNTVLVALQWLDGMLPIGNDLLVRQHFQADERAYSPAGTLVSPVRASEVALGGFAVTLALLFWWIGWNTNRLFLADLDESVRKPAGGFDRLWARCTPDEQMVLVQIARERIANPYQRPLVQLLLQKGLLRLKPDVQPFSDAFDRFLRVKEQELGPVIEEWEKVHLCHSWRYGRLILGASVACIGTFLIATQPGLQSNLVGIATGITGLLTAGFKFRDALTAWFSGEKKLTA